MSLKVGPVACGVVVVLLAVLAAGCGGDEDPGEAESWAGDVCSATLSWTNTLDDAKSTLSDTSSLSVDSARDAVQSVVDGTQSLVTSLKDLGPPDIDAGEQAQDIVGTLETTLEQQKDAIDTALGSVSSPSQLAAAVATVAGALSSMLSAAQTTITQLGQIDAGDELKSAFEDADSCQELSTTR